MAETDVIGKTYEPVKYEVGLEKIKEYAFATNDDNPLYTDEEAAKAGPHGGIVAPPLFAVVYMKDMMARVLFDKELDLNYAMLVHGEQEFEFFDVVRPGDIVWTDGTISSIDYKDDKKIVSCKCTAKVNGKKVCEGTYTFVVRGQ